MSTSLLFTPFKIGHMTLQHRIALAPLTRNRADADNVPGDIVATYYAQRASLPGTLLIAEATSISEEAASYPHVPGIYSEDQVKAWKKVTEAVHARGSYIFLQLRAFGRTAMAEDLAKNGYYLLSSSDIPMAGRPVPKAMTKEDIQRFVQYYARAAKTAVGEADFDGVEIHGANGYLVDQFIQDVSNKRTDEYGGSIENRARFALEVVNAVAMTIGQEKTGIRLSPWSQFQDMRMADPVPTFSYLITSLRDSYPSLAYIHLIEPRISGNVDSDGPASESNDFAREIWKGRPFLTAGGYMAESAKECIGKKGDVIVFGRYFIANPDLPLRIKHSIPFAPYNRETFYVKGTDKVQGYIDYPTATTTEEQRNGTL